jgi:hypothetical protein
MRDVLVLGYHAVSESWVASLAVPPRHTARAARLATVTRLPARRLSSAVGRLVKRLAWLKSAERAPREHVAKRRCDAARTAGMAFNVRADPANRRELEPDALALRLCADARRRPDEYADDQFGAPRADHPPRSAASNALVVRCLGPGRQQAYHARGRGLVDVGDRARGHRDLDLARAHRAKAARGRVAFSFRCLPGPRRERLSGVS